MINPDSRWRVLVLFNGGIIASYGNIFSPGFLKLTYLETLNINEMQYNILFSIPGFMILPGLAV